MPGQNSHISVGLPCTEAVSCLTLRLSCARVALPCRLQSQVFIVSKLHSLHQICLCRRSSAKLRKRAAADEDDDDGDGNDESPAKKKKRPKLPTEDDFFNLDDMEKFVEDAEREAGSCPS